MVLYPLVLRVRQNRQVLHNSDLATPQLAPKWHQISYVLPEKHHQYAIKVHYFQTQILD